MGEKWEKGKSPVELYWASMSPEERERKKNEMDAKRRATFEKRRQEKLALRSQAESLLPQLIAEDLLLASEKNYVPKQSTIDKFKELVESGYMTTEELRRKHFSSLTDDAWHRVLKFVFKSSVSNVEDVGLELVQAKDAAIRAIQDRLKDLNREIKKYRAKDKKKPIPLGLLDRKYEAEKDLIKINSDWARTLHSIGAVGDKSKSPVFHLHLSTPRPSGKKEKVIEVPPTQLEKLIADKNGNRD